MTQGRQRGFPSLEGRNAVVTGGGSGLGRAIAQRLARDGAAVAIWARTPGPAEEVAEAIVQDGGRAVVCIGDATVKADIAASLDRTHRELGDVSILVNNAGIAPFSPFLDITEADMLEVLRANVAGPFLCTQAVIPDMLAKQWGRVVNISSTAAQDGIGIMAHYAASKGGVIGMTKSLAMEFAATGITFNHVPPFFVDTPMLREAPLDLDATAAATPMGRMGRASEVAAACAYLVSDEAAYVTGQALSLNGGRYLA